MMSMIRNTSRFLRRFRKEDAGSPSVEFVLVFPAFIFIIVSAFELGLLMTRHVMMERGLDMAVREVRLNTGNPITEVQFQKMICNTAGLIPDCQNALRLEMRPLSMRFDGHQSDNSIPRAASCTNVNNPFEPARNFTSGLPNQMMVVRACGVFSPMLPTFGLGAWLSQGAGGKYRLVSTTAFVMEPV